MRGDGPEAGGVRVVRAGRAAAHARRTSQERTEGTVLHHNVSIATLARVT